MSGDSEGTEAGSVRPRGGRRLLPGASVHGFGPRPAARPAERRLRGVLAPRQAAQTRGQDDRAAVTGAARRRNQARPNFYQGRQRSVGESEGGR